MRIYALVFNNDETTSRIRRYCDVKELMDARSFGDILCLKIAVFVIVRRIVAWI